ncbi:Ankyrin repeat-containing domain protein [Tylopilus felleus]
MAVKLLVSCGCDPFVRGETPLHVAVQHGHISVARHLLNLGAYFPPNLLVTLDRDERSCTACMIHFLFDNGVNILARTSDGDSVLHIVLESAYDDGEAFTAMKFLVSHGCDPLEANLRGITPLHVAVKEGHVSAARYLLTLGAVLPPDLLVTLTGDSSGWSTVSVIHFLYKESIFLRMLATVTLCFTGCCSVPMTTEAFWRS